MKILNCIECGLPLTSITPSQYNCSRGHTYWNSPSSAVSVIFIKDNFILFSQRANEPARGLYNLPGGFCEHMEDPLDTAEREVQEETGMNLDKRSLVIMGAYTNKYIGDESVCDIVFLAHSWSGTPIADDDSASLEWKPLEFLDDAYFAPNFPGLSDKLRSLGESKL